MRKRIPRYANGEVHMSDVDKIRLRQFQTQGQVNQLYDIIGQDIFTGGNTFTAEEQEQFKDLYGKRLDRLYTRGRGQRADNIIARKFPNLSDRDKMLLIDMYTPDMYVNPFDKPMINYGGNMMQPQMRKGGSKNWIKDAIKKPGALKATAKRAGALKKDGTIKKSWLQQQAKKGNSKTAQRARLALTLGKMKK